MIATLGTSQKWGGRKNKKPLAWSVIRPTSLVGLLPRLMVKVPSIQHLKGINILEKSLTMARFFALNIVGYDESDELIYFYRPSLG